MSEKKRILALGCSHVAGCEIRDTWPRLHLLRRGLITLESLDDINRPLSFPMVLADLLDWHCDNLAMSGASNDRSVRLLAQSLQQQHYDLILFGWTCEDRREFYWPDQGPVWGRDSQNYLQVGLQFTEQSTASGLEHPVNHLYIEHFLRPDPQRVLDQYWMVDNTCQQQGVPIIHLRMAESLPKFTKSFDFQGQDNYLSWARGRGFAPRTYGHYGEDAHLALAKLIKSQL